MPSILFAEVATIRGEVSARDSALAAAEARITELTSRTASKDLEAKLSAAQAEIARLEGLLRAAEARIAQLTHALSDCEAHRRKFEDLEATHSVVRQRLEAARTADEFINRPPSSPSSQQSPGGRGERIRYIPPTGFG